MRVHRLILDGRNLLWRTADAFSDLTATVDGQEIATGGMYGFLCVTLRVHERFGGQTVVAWEGQEASEGRARNFRFDLYPAYKSKEPMTPEACEERVEMRDQEERLKLLLYHCGVYQYLGDGCEADDVIGRLVHEASARGLTSVIYSGDSDVRQLVSDRVFVACPEKGKRRPGKRRPGKRVLDHLYDVQAVQAKHAVAPSLIAQLKALSGDDSDNIAGVPGIGPKYAAKILNHYGSLNAAIRAAIGSDPGWPVSERLRAALDASALDVLLYYKLTRIRTNMRMDVIEPCADQRAVIKQLMAYKFRSLIEHSSLAGLMQLGEPANDG